MLLWVTIVFYIVGAVFVTVARLRFLRAAHESVFDALECSLRQRGLPIPPNDPSFRRGMKLGLAFSLVCGAILWPIAVALWWPQKTQCHKKEV